MWRTVFLVLALGVVPAGAQTMIRQPEDAVARRRQPGVLAAGLDQSGPVALDRSGFTLVASETTLSPDGTQGVTLIAFLSDGFGNVLDDEQVVFTLEEGTGTLSTPPLGTQVDRVLGRFTSFGLRGGSSFFNALQAVDALPVGDGQYVARFHPGSTTGPVRIRATWVSSNDAPLPFADAQLEVRQVAGLAVRVGNPTLDTDVVHSTSVIAYVWDERGRPVDDLQVTFSVVRGTGEITGQVVNANGRYATVYVAGLSAGTELVRATVSNGTTFLSETVEIEVAAPSVLEAFAFPQVVRRLGQTGALHQENIATILLLVRDGRGVPTSGLGPNNLVAEVVSGPGAVTDVEEVPLELFSSGDGSGVYQATFIAGDAVGESVVRFTNLSASTRSTASVTVRTEQVTGTAGGVASRLEALALGRDPLVADGLGAMLLVAFPDNVDGLAVTNDARNLFDEDLTFTVVQGSGAVDPGHLLPSQVAGLDSGLFVAGYLSSSEAQATTAVVRATLTNPGGETLVAETPVHLLPNAGPEVVIFPPLVPATAAGLATVDVYDFDADTDFAEEQDSGRYLLDIVSGSGLVLEEPQNDGVGFDLVVDDHVHTGLYQSGGAVGQEAELMVTDLLNAGLPRASATIANSTATRLQVVVFPDILDPGEAAAVIIFASDAFGDPVLDEDMVVSLVSGGGEVLLGGVAVDDGQPLEVTEDVYAADGVYVAEFVASPLVRGPAVLRVVDLSDPTELVVEVGVDVR